MATFAKRGNRWRAQIRRQGKSVSKTFATKTEARLWAEREETRVLETAEAEANLAAPPGTTFGDLMDKYARERSSRKKGSRWEIIRLEKFCRDPIADVPLTDLSARHFTEWRDRSSASLAASSINREMNLLSAVCTAALKEWQWLREHPMRGVQRLKAGKPRDRRPTQEEIKAILAAAKYTGEEPPTNTTQRVGLAFLWAMETAMRAGEIAACRREHVYIDRRLLYIPESKNDHARTIPLTKEAVRLAGLLDPVTGGEELLFGLSSMQISSNFRRLCKAAEVENLTFHDTRREAASRLSKKLSVMDLAKVTGHKDVRMLQNVYYAPDVADFIELIDRE